MTGEPPPLPWKVRVQPEVIFLLCSAAVLLFGMLWCAASAAGWHGWVCAWKSGTGLPCAGCGTTRSMVLLAGGSWRAALQLNPAAVLLLPLWGTAALYAAAVLIFRLEPWRPAALAGWPWRWIAVGILLANWTYLLAAGLA
jgi:hypothetical protein